MRARFIPAMMLITLMCAPALAQTQAEHHGRRTAAEHFADANTTHDGHLTLDQATSGYKSLAKSFSQIDISHHGYITMDDIKAWRAAKKAAKQAAKAAAKSASDDTTDGVVRPMPAAQRGAVPDATDISTDVVAPRSMGTPRVGVDLPMAKHDGG